MEDLRKPVNQSLLLFFICLGAGTIGAVFLYPFTLEDALITFHYAHAFAAGQGIGIWNVGEPPVEGFSSALWMFLLGFGEKLNLSPFVVAKVAGYLGYALTSALFLIASRRPIKNNPAATAQQETSRALYLAAILSALLVPLIFYSMSGMEATFCCFEVAALLLTPFLLHSSAGRAGWSALFAAALVFTRPEGFVAALAINTYWLFASKKQNRWPLVAIGSTLATLATMTLYRIVHFGQVAPNTYFAKTTGGTLAHRLFLGARYDLAFFVGLLPWTIVFLVGTYILGKDLLAKTSRPPGVRLFLWGLFLFFAVSILKVGGDASGAFPLYRQFQQIAPIWILFAAFTIVHLVHDLRKAVWYSLAVVLLTDAQVIQHNPFLLQKKPKELYARYGLFHLEPPNPYFLWLRQFSTPDTLTAVSLAGQWPFYVPGRYIDNLGLNDPHIAKYGHVQLTSTIIDSKSDMAYVLSRRPDIIDGYSSGFLIKAGLCPFDELARAEMTNDMKNQPSFQANYVFIRNAPYLDLDRALFFRKDFAARFPGKLEAVPVTETSLYRPGCPFEP